MAKKESQDGKSKKGLPRLMELAMTQKAPMVGGMLLSAMATIASFLPYLAIYFIIQEIVGAYPDLTTLDRSLIHIPEPTRPLSISHADFCLKKKNPCAARPPPTTTQR